MFTIFDFLVLAGAVFGAATGATLAKDWLGWVGLVVGALAGCFLGAIFGRLPYVISLELMKRDIRRCDVATLRSRIEKEYFISRFIIAELLARGEPIESFRDYVAGLRSSDSADRRRFGEQLLRIWPEAGLPPHSTATEKGPSV